MIIIDNYFKYPNTIRDHALNNVEYKEKEPGDGWEGYRSAMLSKYDDLEREVVFKIEDTLQSQLNIELQKLKVYFHCSPITVMEDIDDFHTMKWHDDFSDYAGVIYLTPNPPKNTGTCFKNGDCVENIYNRFLCYPGKVIHAPDNLFGDDLQSTRLTITFFAWTTNGEFEEFIQFS